MATKRQNNLLKARQRTRKRFKLGLQPPFLHIALCNLIHHPKVNTPLRGCNDHSNTLVIILKSAFMAHLGRYVMNLFSFSKIKGLNLWLTWDTLSCCGQMVYQRCTWEAPKLLCFAQKKRAHFAKTLPLAHTSVKRGGTFL